MLYPMFAMVLLTYAAMLHIYRTRVTAYKTGQLPGSYFKLFQGVEVPPQVQVATRHFNNLFEVPVLFYAAAITGIMLQHETALAIGLAWLFVALRVVHSLIHLTSNHILWRVRSFMAGNIVLLALWIVLVCGG